MAGQFTGQQAPIPICDYTDQIFMQGEPEFVACKQKQGVKTPASSRYKARNRYADLEPGIKKTPNQDTGRIQTKDTQGKETSEQTKDTLGSVADSRLSELGSRLKTLRAE